MTPASHRIFIPPNISLSPKDDVIVDNFEPKDTTTTINKPPQIGELPNRPMNGRFHFSDLFGNSTEMSEKY